MNKKLIFITRLLYAFSLIFLIGAFTAVSYDNEPVARLLFYIVFGLLFAALFLVIIRIPFYLKENKQKVKKEAERESMQQRITALENEIKKIKEIKHS